MLRIFIKYWPALLILAMLMFVTILLTLESMRHTEDDEILSRCVAAKRAAGIEEKRELIGLGPYGVPQYQSSVVSTCRREFPEESLLSWLRRRWANV